MNKVVLIGRPVKDPEVRYANKQDGEEMCIARYNLAVDRKSKKNEADFISCVCFGKQAESAEKYIQKGVKIAVSGRLQTGSYTNKDNQKVYTTDVVVEEHDFCEKKSGASEAVSGDEKEGFVNIPEGIENDLPFK